MRFRELMQFRNGAAMRGIFIPEDKWEDTKERLKGQIDVHCSPYWYHADSVEELTRPGVDYSKVPKSGGFYADFDCKEKRELAKLEAEAVMSRLPFATLFDSGNKGYHLECEWDSFGIEPDPNLHIRFKEYAKTLASKLHLTKIDLNPYNGHAMLRLRDTLNPKGLAHKVEISTNRNVPEKLRNSIDEFLSTEWKAREPKPSLALPDGVKGTFEPWFERMLKSPPLEGERNAAMYHALLYLKKLNWSEDEAQEFMMRNSWGLKPSEVQGSVKSAYSNGKMFGITADSASSSYMTDDEKYANKLVDEQVMLKSWDAVVDITKDKFLSEKKYNLYSFGWDNLDRHCGMIMETELIVVGGIPGIGKSEFVWNIAKKNSEAKVPVGFIGLEMSPEMYALRTIRNKVSISPAKFRMMDISAEEKASILKAIEELKGHPVPLHFFDTKFVLNIDKLKRLVRIGKERLGIRLWIIDHLHWFPSVTDGDSSSMETTNKIVHAIKNLANQEEVAIVLVSHLRKLQEGKDPTMNDFKDTSAIAQVADLCLGLSRPQYADTVAMQSMVECRILKARSGVPTARLHSQFDPLTGVYTATNDAIIGLGNLNPEHVHI